MDRSKIIAVTAAIIIIVGGYFIYLSFGRNKPIRNPAALSVNSFFSEAQVFVNDEPQGSTPLYKESLESGQVNLTLRGDSNIFESKITLSPDTLTVVNRDLGVPGGFSAGEIIWLEKSSFGPSLSVISDPSGAKILIDGVDAGETPLSTTSISSSDHEITISKSGFESRSVKVKVQDGFKLNVSSQLFPRPIPLEIKGMESPSEQLTIYNLSLDSDISTSESKVLARAISYFLQTRGEEAVSFDYFADSQGTLFDSEGVKILDESELTKGEYIVGYIGTSQKDELSTPAEQKLIALASGKGAPESEGGEDSTKVKAQVEILPTGTGWLRVRSGPGLGNTEITKVNVGDKFDLLSEEAGWSKIKLSDGTEGWVSSQYVKSL